MEGIGYTPTMISNIRTMGANAVASTKQGRCPITAIAIAKGIRWDPWIMGPTNTIMHMIEIIMGRGCRPAMD
eukprot:8668083-Karenia_brevis.AAC.1